MPRNNSTPPSEPAKSGLLKPADPLEVNKTPDIVKPVSLRPCPPCKGRGYDLAVTMIGDTMMQYEKRCWRCQGSGKITEADDDD